VIERLVRSRLLRVGFVVAAVALCALAITQYGSEISAAAVDIGWLSIAGALVAALAGTGFSLLAWRRVLTELGSPLPLSAAVRVFSLSQLGKYIPGSVWPFLAQVELGREHGVPRRRTATALGLAIVVSLVSAGLVAAVTLPFAASAAARSYWWGLASAPFLAALLHPAVLNPLLDRLLRLAGRPPLEHRLTLRGIVGVLGWSVAAWLAYGVHVYLLARDLGGSGASLLPAAIGAYALAWSIGFLVVVAPAGAGVREVVLAAALAGSIGRAPVILLVVASRLLITVADLAWAGAGVALGRAHLRQVPEEMAEAEALRAAQRTASAAASPRGSQPVEPAATPPAPS